LHRAGPPALPPRSVLDRDHGQVSHGQGGPDGNERLTAITGAMLLVLFAAEGVTILSLHRLLYWHFFIGLLLIGPVGLKIGSTGYRFARYYTRHPGYVRKGPPAPLLRLLGPMVMLSSMAVLGTGVLLGLASHDSSVAGLSLLELHKLSFLLWAAVMTVHVLAYIWRLPRLIGADLAAPRTRRAAEIVSGRGLRWSLAAACLGAGVVIALAGGHLAGTWQQGGPQPSKQSGLAIRPHAPPLTPAASTPLTLQVIPAPYQLPSGIEREAVFSQGPDLVIAGGLTGASGTTAAIVSLDPVTGQTTPAGRLAVATHDAAAAMAGGRALVFGGGVQASTADVQELPGAQPGRVIARLPLARSDVSAVTLGPTAYLAGGYDGVTYDPRILATSNGTRYRIVARLPVPVRYTAVAAAGHWLWTFGGETPAGPTDVIQQVNLVTGQASIAGHLPARLEGAAGFSLDGRIFIAGGQTAAQGPKGVSGAVFSYTPGRPGVQAAGRLPVPVAYAAATVHDGTAFILGGDNGTHQVPAVTMLRLVPASATAASSTAAAAPWLGPPLSGSHLIPGSDPSVLPGDVLIADNHNSRLLIVDPQGRVRWRFPGPGDLARGQSFLLPDDAFFSPDGKYVIATEEDYSVISVISIAQHKIVYRYGTPGVPGSSDNHVSNPDDAMMMPNGMLITADIKNCRVLLLPAVQRDLHRPARVIGQTGVCGHNPPHLFGSPNGAFPATDGNYIVTEINGDWADEIGLTGQVRWSVHPPGVTYPSDTNEIYPGRYLTVDYSPAGQVVEFNARGRLLWRFGGLNHPSLALPLPNGDILVNDDYNDRVIVIDPAAHRIVWQYGHTGRPGTAPGYLNDPDGVDITPPDSMLIIHAATMGQPQP
jgi:hypothetical protein